MNTTPRKPLAREVIVLHIYLRRRTTLKAPGVRGWFERTQVSRYLEATPDAPMDAVLVRFDGAALSLSTTELV